MKRIASHLAHALLMTLAAVTMTFVFNAVISSMVYGAQPGSIRVWTTLAVSAALFGAMTRRYYVNSAYYTAALAAGGVVAGMIGEIIGWPVVSAGLIAGFLIPVPRMKKLSNER